jgi:hypothetical protein
MIDMRLTYDSLVDLEESDNLKDLGIDANVNDVGYRFAR